MSIVLLRKKKNVPSFVQKAFAIPSFDSTWMDIARKVEQKDARVNDRERKVMMTKVRLQSMQTRE